ncbi:MAG: uncharacterized protein KVP18_000332 [Porospora cf. gigantea A]|uniref:uncharacterized protein n=1 Tax=Porospora cf. gigantea A TaxID=2853593 RepID=UPI00355AA89A|nr:MAG: hypothetical protein KVP18_000332 [Porospora cf. gigantea A]
MELAALLTRGYLGEPEATRKLVDLQNEDCSRYACSLLDTLEACHDLTSDTGFLLLVSAKGAVERAWKATKSPAEKRLLKTSLLRLTRRALPVLDGELLFAALRAPIRSDFPMMWPEMEAYLTESLLEFPTLPHNERLRALALLVRTAEELSGRKALAGRKVFRVLTEAYFTPLMELESALMEAPLSALEREEELATVHKGLLIFCRHGGVERDIVGPFVTSVLNQLLLRMESQMLGLWGMAVVPPLADLAAYDICPFLSSEGLLSRTLWTLSEFMIAHQTSSRDALDTLNPLLTGLVHSSLGLLFPNRAVDGLLTTGLYEASFEEQPEVWADLQSRCALELTQLATAAGSPTGVLALFETILRLLVPFEPDHLQCSTRDALLVCEVSLLSTREASEPVVEFIGRNLDGSPLDSDAVMRCALCLESLSLLLGTEAGGSNGLEESCIPEPSDLTLRCIKEVAPRVAVTMKSLPKDFAGFCYTRFASILFGCHHLPSVTLLPAVQTLVAIINDPSSPVDILGIAVDSCLSRATNNSDSPVWHTVVDTTTLLDRFVVGLVNVAWAAPSVEITRTALKAVYAVIFEAAPTVRTSVISRLIPLMSSDLRGEDLAVVFPSALDIVIGSVEDLGSITTVEMSPLLRMCDIRLQTADTYISSLLARLLVVLLNCSLGGSTEEPLLDFVLNHWFLLASRAENPPSFEFTELLIALTSATSLHPPRRALYASWLDTSVPLHLQGIQAGLSSDDQDCLQLLSGIRLFGAVSRLCDAQSPLLSAIAMVIDQVVTHSPTADSFDQKGLRQADLVEFLMLVPVEAFAQW